MAGMGLLMEITSQRFPICSTQHNFAEIYSFFGSLRAVLLHHKRKIRFETTSSLMRLFAS
jgi:hypothetical protein